ncbi:MAG: hypothetical protein CTY16_00425 [Methylobacter sp.]|nr:MAG: hypothetical protein CTY16_00425 [Methylobacter sp.]
MGKIIKVAAVVFISLIGLAITSLVLVSEFLSGMCGNEIIQNALSPGNHFKAILFSRDCGATTNFNTHISLIAPDEGLPNESGNVFIVNGDPKDLNIEIDWLTPTDLVVRHAAGLTAHKKENRYRGITVTYK